MVSEGKDRNLNQKQKMKSEEFYRIYWKTQNEAPLNPPEGWKSKAKKPPPTSPKGERAKLLGVKSEEQRTTMWTDIWFKVQGSRFKVQGSTAPFRPSAFATFFRVVNGGVVSISAS